jgi:hypothetical protein
VRLFKRTLSPTLLLSEAGVLVEAVEHHLFPPGGQKAGPHLEEIATPPGSASIAVQFVHEVGHRFSGLQAFRLSYFHRAPGRDLFEEYLAVPYDRLQFVATPVDVALLGEQPRRVIATLLSKSDERAWGASEAFRSELEGRRPAGSPFD